MQIDKHEKNPNSYSFYPNGWHTILETKQIDRGQQILITRFGKDIVLYRDITGIVHAFEAYCAHTGNNLSIVSRNVVISDSICFHHGLKYNHLDISIQKQGNKFK